MTSEATHQFLISRGFRIFRKNINHPIIEMKNSGKPGWTRYHVSPNRQAMEKLFNELLEDTKTLADI